MKQLEIIYYLCTSFFIVYELYALFNTKAFIAVHNYADEINKTKDYSLNEEAKAIIYMAIVGSIYALWLLAGLLTFQWFPFLLLIFTSVVFKRAIKLRKPLGLKLDALISLCLLLFIITNKIWLNISLF